MSTQKCRAEVKELGRRSQRTNHGKPRNRFCKFDGLGDVSSWKLKLGCLGLQLREVEGDGNCLFRALSDQLTGSIASHLEYRAAVVEFMRQNRADFEPFVEGSSFEEHLRALAKPGTWGDNDALVAFARLNQLNIIVHRLDLPAMQIHGTDSPKARELHVAYHDDLHYSSVRKAGDSSSQPSNIRVQQQQQASPKPESHQPRRYFELEPYECDTDFVESTNENPAHTTLTDEDHLEALNDSLLELGCQASLEHVDSQAATITASATSYASHEISTEAQLVVGGSRSNTSSAKQAAVRKRDKKKEKKQRAAERHRALLKSDTEVGHGASGRSKDDDDVLIIDSLQTLRI